MKRFLFAVAAVVCCSSSIFAQDIFFAFGSGAASTDSQSLDVTTDGTTGQVNLYSRTGLALDGIQFGFEVNTDVVELTGGSAFDETFNVLVIS